MDRTPGQAGKEEGMGRAWEHAPELWKVEALAAVKKVAENRDFLTVDDIWPLVGDPPEKRAWGPLMRSACANKRQYIKITEQRVPSRRPATHDGERAVYQSRLRKVITKAPSKRSQSLIEALEDEKVDNFLHDYTGPDGIQREAFVQTIHRRMLLGQTIEIVGPDGKVHYRRSAGHPDVEEAQKTPGYSIRREAQS